MMIDHDELSTPTEFEAQEGEGKTPASEAQEGERELSTLDANKLPDEPAVMEGDTAPLPARDAPKPPPVLEKRFADDQETRLMSSAQPTLAAKPSQSAQANQTTSASQSAPRYHPVAGQQAAQQQAAQPQSSASLRPTYYQQPQQPPRQSAPARPVYTYGPPAKPPTHRAAPKQKKAKEPRNTMSCLFRSVFGSLFVFVLMFLCLITFGFYQYYNIASQLPDIQDLRLRASQFETTRILDRNGDLLYEIVDPNAGRRTYVTLDKISPFLVAATIATEDKEFYNHPGFDIMAIARAFYQNYQGQTTVSGASTITQQLARVLLLSPEERVEQSYSRKLREAILAAEITRRYSKDEILELYINEIYYSNLAYGVEAAAETYFKTSASALTLGQAVFLAGLPQAPGVYDIYTNPEATLKRFEDVLVLTYQLSVEEGCIYVSNSPQRICLDPVVVTAASEEIKNYTFHSPDIQMRYPHWVNYIRSLLEAQYDAQTIYRSGFTVYTTLDPKLQDLAQQAVKNQVESMNAQNATGGALVAIRPSNGEILAMVGSPDFDNDAASGQINMAVSPRQPGSAIKPLTYLAAFEKGWTPSTLIWDVPSEFTPSGLPNDNMPAYIPSNYDGRFHGPVTVRTALSNSYNVPAVKALQFVGIYDDPATPAQDGLVNFARRIGITTLTGDQYGLSLTLGGGEVTLLELTNAFATMGNYGRRYNPVAITRIMDHNGNLVFENPQQPGEQVLRAEHAYLMASILSDNQARSAAFGANSVLKLPFDAAVKTGTTNDFRDNWTVGFSPDLAVGVWVGNPDYTPMQNTSGLTGAAPIWSTVMQAAVQEITGGNPTRFSPPAGIVEQTVCEVSGTLPSEWCPKTRKELFAVDQPPLPKEEDLWQKTYVDTWTGLRASAACPDYYEEVFVLNVTDQWAKKWLRKDSQGQAWADKMGFEKPLIFTPSRECRADDPRPILGFAAPRENDTIVANQVDVYAVVDATHGFEFFRLEYGLGDKPDGWKVLTESNARVRNPEKIYQWDTSEVPSGRITLRLTVFGSDDAYAKEEIHINLQAPTPTPTATPMPTYTPAPTSTPFPTSTPWPTLPPVITLPPVWPTEIPTLPVFPTEPVLPTVTPGGDTG